MNLEDNVHKRRNKAWVDCYSIFVYAIVAANIITVVVFAGTATTNVFVMLVAY